MLPGRDADGACKGGRGLRWLPLFASLCAGLAIASVALGQGQSSTASPPSLLLPRQAISANELAVIVNDLDPLSVQVARYYAERRQLPSPNLIHIRFAPGHRAMDPVMFGTLYTQVQAATPANVQAYVLTWNEPYRVGCMSITTAFAMGYSESFCASGCQPTQPSGYFASASSSPHSDHGMRPTMALAGANLAAMKSLIDRGVASDETYPGGTAYLIKTSDPARSVRAQGFDRVTELAGKTIKIERLDTDSIANRNDVLFYFTGAVRVPDLATNHFVPGAVADHLTSTGGQLTDSRQMSSLRWLDAGATGSYGSVVEPCNFPAKFPDPATLISHYLSGSTLIESYWKSVLMPGQGIFIGEPLARPYGGYTASTSDNAWKLSIYALKLGRYRLQIAQTPIGPYRDLATLNKTNYAPLELRLPLEGGGYYRILGQD